MPPGSNRGRYEFQQPLASKCTPNFISVKYREIHPVGTLTHRNVAYVATLDAILFMILNHVFFLSSERDPKAAGLTLLLSCISELPGSNLRWGTDYSDWGHLWLFSVPPLKYQDVFSVRPLPIPSTSSISLLLNHSTIFGQTYWQGCQMNYRYPRKNIVLAVCSPYFRVRAAGFSLRYAPVAIAVWKRGSIKPVAEFVSHSSGYSGRYGIYFLHNLSNFKAQSLKSSNVPLFLSRRLFNDVSSIEAIWYRVIGLAMNNES
jgi:hypothetical protein